MWMNQAIEASEGFIEVASHPLSHVPCVLLQVSPSASAGVRQDVRPWPTWRLRTGNDLQGDHFHRWSSAVHDAGVPSKCKHPVLETDSNHLFEKVHMAMWQYRLEMAANSCVIPGQDQRIWHLWASTPWVVHHVSVLWGLAWLWAEPMPDRKYDCIYQEFGLWTQEIYTCFRF